jgi:FtsH-binding integral membrane protein
MRSSYKYVDIESTELVQPVVNFRGYRTDPIHSALISKVYALLSSQLLITTLVVVPMYIHKQYILSHQPQFFWPSVVFLFLMLGAMFITRGFVKLVTSLLFAGINGLMLGSAIVEYNYDILLHATVITLSTTIFCSVLVHVTNVNLHHWGGILFTLLWIMVLTSFMLIFFPISGIANTLYCVFGIILFVAYLLYDTSELRHVYVYDDDQYVIMATGIYLDIINLFLYILRLMSKTNN